jgi:hypothetical protein
MTNMQAGQFLPDRALAEQHLRTAEELAVGNSAFFLLPTAEAYRRFGLDGDVARALDRYEQLAGSALVGMGDWARYHLARGDMDEAYAALRSAIETLEAGEADPGFFSLEVFAADPTDPRLAEERFQDLLARLQALRAD